MNLAQWNKALLALIGGVLTWGAQVVASTSTAVTAPEWLGLAGIAAAAFGVLMIPNAAATTPKPPVAAPVMPEKPVG